MIDTPLCEFGIVGQNQDVSIHGVPPDRLEVHHANRQSAYRQRAQPVTHRFQDFDARPHQSDRNNKVSQRDSSARKRSFATCLAAINEGRECSPVTVGMRSFTHPVDNIEAGCD